MAEEKTHWEWVIETPLEYPTHYNRVCGCHDIHSALAVIEYLLRQARLEEYPIRIRKIPVRSE